MKLSANADMVIEAVFEGMALKKEVFAELDRVCKSGAILASNTSTLNIDEIASATSRPAVRDRYAFLQSRKRDAPARNCPRQSHRARKSSPPACSSRKKLGKIGVLVGNCRGFVGNRMFHPYVRESVFLLEEGASVEAVDSALYDFGMAMGPLAVGDLAGLDVGWRIRKEYRAPRKARDSSALSPGINSARWAATARKPALAGTSTTKVDARFLIRKSQQLVRKWAAEAGIPQRQISKEEIVDRCVYALVNEGARILEEGFALRAVDIDIIYLNGYGFPAYRGGPMWYADTVGLKKVCDRIEEFHKQHGDLWEPAPLLKRLAEEGKKFADYNKEQSATA